uniref:signaling mucin HKR1-like n=1 Tax=Monopterus albus TaxID=43700 RepID=UPI0009B324C3|nr:signaling mucin HKR1-like [Monopterus albus]
MDSASPGASFLSSPFASHGLNQPRSLIAEIYLSPADAQDIYKQLKAQMYSPFSFLSEVAPKPSPPQTVLPSMWLGAFSLSPVPKPAPVSTSFASSPFAAATFRCSPSSSSPAAASTYSPSSSLPAAASTYSTASSSPAAASTCSPASSLPKLPEPSFEPDLQLPQPSSQPDLQLPQPSSPSSPVPVSGLVGWCADAASSPTPVSGQAGRLAHPHRIRPCFRVGRQRRHSPASRS